MVCPRASGALWQLQSGSQRGYAVRRLDRELILERLDDATCTRHALGALEASCPHNALSLKKLRIAVLTSGEFRALDATLPSLEQHVRQPLLHVADVYSFAYLWAVGSCTALQIPPHCLVFS